MVGSHLLDYLVECTDWEIHGICRWRSPLENIGKHIEAINDKDRVFLHYADIRELGAIQEIFKKNRFDYVFHLAAQSYPKTSFDSPIETYDSNINGTENVLKAIKEYAKDAVAHICSSSEVFGRVPKEFVPINEECRFHPASPYAISKCGTDLIGRYYAEAYGINTQITRMFTHTGPRRGDVFMESSFAKQIALIEKGYQEPLVRVGNLDSLRTIADVRDAVRAYYLLVTTKPEAGATYNIGGDVTVKVGDILRKLISMSNVEDIEYIIDPERLRPIDADLQVPNTNKFRVKTGWKPEIKYEKTLEDLLEYWREKVSTNKGRYLNR